MKKIFVLFCFFIHYSCSDCIGQATDTLETIKTVDFVVGAALANHGRFRFRGERQRAAIDKITNSPEQYDYAVKVLMADYIRQRNLNKIGVLSRLIEYINRIENMPILVDLLGQLEEVGDAVKADRSVDSFNYVRRVQYVKNIRCGVIIKLYKNNYKDDRVKEICLQLLEEKENYGSFRACLQYFANCYADDQETLARLDSVLKEHDFHGFESLGSFYDQLFKK